MCAMIEKFRRRDWGMATRRECTGARWSARASPYAAYTWGGRPMARPQAEGANVQVHGREERDPPCAAEALPRAVGLHRRYALRADGRAHRRRVPLGAGAGGMDGPARRRPA